LAPNQTTTLTTSFIDSEDGGNPGPGPTSNYTVSLSNICFWTSAPDLQSDSNHTNDAYCTNISFVATVGIKGFTEKESTLINYPNPFNESFEVSVSNNLISSIEIYSVDGKLVKQFDGLNTANTSINFPELESGLYFLKIYLKDNQSKIIKIIKN
jgi:hypothetical protein